MHFSWVALVTLCFFPLIPSFADSFSIGGGVEQFYWKEYDSVTKEKLLEESGPRYFVSLDSTRLMEGDLIYGFHGRVYSGSVDYDGQFQDGTPAKSKTDYSGVSAELDFTWSIRPFWGLRYGIGFDVWRRNILGTGGYLEKYALAYSRLGASYEREGGSGAYFGVKLPLLVDERVELGQYGYDDLKLKPQGDFSLFAQFQVPLGRYWRADLHYDSYRFKKSADVVLTWGGVPVGGTAHQPESHQDSYGVSLSYVF